MCHLGRLHSLLVVDMGAGFAVVALVVALEELVLLLLVVVGRQLAMLLVLEELVLLLLVVVVVVLLLLLVVLLLDGLSLPARGLLSALETSSSIGAEFQMDPAHAKTVYT